MKFVALLILLIGSYLFGCATNTTNETALVPANSPTESPFPTPTPIALNKSLFDKKPQYLCDRLSELKHMPKDRDEPSGDAIYDALRENHYYSLPCLVEKITDTRPVERPGTAPFMSGLTYRVGDTAVLMLMRYDEMYWPKGMLPKKYEDMFKEQGMFAYYFYVDEVPEARKEIQRWWKKWLKTCQPDCEKLPTLERN